VAVITSTRAAEQGPPLPKPPHLSSVDHIKRFLFSKNSRFEFAQSGKRPTKTTCTNKTTWLIFTAFRCTNHPQGLHLRVTPRLPSMPHSQHHPSLCLHQCVPQHVSPFCSLYPERMDCFVHHSRSVLTSPQSLVRRLLQCMVSATF
jgi:hypothetical protein